MTNMEQDKGKGKGKATLGGRVTKSKSTSPNGPGLAFPTFTSRDPLVTIESADESSDSSVEDSDFGEATAETPPSTNGDNGDNGEDALEADGTAAVPRSSIKRTLEDLKTENMTAYDVIREHYGLSVAAHIAKRRKYVSFIDDPAVRWPVQRSAQHVFRSGRAANGEALVVQIISTEMEQACTHCQKRDGPWEGCVVMKDTMMSSCSNCWYNSSGARCTFHENPKSKGRKLNLNLNMNLHQMGCLPANNNEHPDVPSTAEVTRLINSSIADTTNMSEHRRLMGRIQHKAEALGFAIRDLQRLAHNGLNPATAAALQQMQAQINAWAQAMSGHAMDFPPQQPFQ